jgi:hypothetical protein
MRVFCLIQIPGNCFTRHESLDRLQPNYLSISARLNKLSWVRLAKALTSMKKNGKNGAQERLAVRPASTKSGVRSPKI